MLNQVLVSILKVVNCLAALMIIFGGTIFGATHFGNTLSQSVGAHPPPISMFVASFLISVVAAGVVCGLLAVLLSIEYSLRVLANNSKSILKPPA